jgi:hypothetical protein
MSPRTPRKYTCVSRCSSLSFNLEGGPNSSVSIATGYGLDGPGIESRWGRDFSHLSRPTLGPTMGTGYFPGVKSGRGVTLTPHPFYYRWPWKSRVIPLLPLRAVRPVQGLSACTRVHFTFFLTYYLDWVGSFTFRLLYRSVHRDYFMVLTTTRFLFRFNRSMWHCFCSNEVYTWCWLRGM